MESSDSEIEMIEVRVCKPKAPYPVSEDELLDIDVDDYDLLPKKKKLASQDDRTDRKASKPTSVNQLKNIVTNLKNNSNSKKRGNQDAIDLIEIEDDNTSLLSLSPPTSPCSSQNVKGVQSSFGAMRFSSESDEFSSINKSKKNSKQKMSSESHKISSQSSTASLADITCTYGKDLEEVNNFFQEAGYASQAEYEADLENDERNKAIVDHSTSHLLLFKPAPAPSTNTKPPKEKNTSKSRKEKETVGKVIKERPKKTAKPAQTKTSCQTAANPPPAVPPQIKPLKPDNILKVMTLKISKDVLSDGLAAELTAKEVQFEIVENVPEASCIQFERNTRFKMVGKDYQVTECVRTEMEENVIIIFDLEKRLELFEAELDNSSESNSETLSDWIKNLQQKHSKKCTLMIYGLEAYLKKISRRVQNEYRKRILNANADSAPAGKRKRKENTKPFINLSRTEIQGILIGVQLETGINYRCYENDKDLALLLYQYVKSVGDAPFKLAKMNSTEFDWYAVSDCTGGIPVEDDGKGTRSLWISQLTQFPNVGQDIAIAIARKYGSPLVLSQAYHRCNTVEEGKLLLSNIMVTMGVGPLAKSRRIGPEASKKIYRFFTARDGEKDIN